MKFDFLNNLPLSVQFSGLGHATGSRKLDNQALLDGYQIKLKPSFIENSIGIESRYFLEDHESTSDMAAAAAKMALEQAGLSIRDVSRLILATSSPDYQTPSTACIVQHKLGGSGFPVMDINAACSGFVYAIDAGARAIATGDRHVLVVGADARSRDLNMQDKRTVFLYGDGAGAAVLSAVGKPERAGAAGGAMSGLLNSILFADGVGYDAVYIPAGGSKTALTHELLDRNHHKLSMPDGTRVAENAKQGFSFLCAEIFEGTPYKKNDVDLFVFHQPNQRLLEGIVAHLDIPPEKAYINFSRYGNTVAGSIPIALSEAQRMGRLNSGDLVLLCGVGGGFTGGAHLIRWNF